MRQVTAPETEKGRYWAEARIKQLTGGDPVAARFMRQDFFEYLPRFKLLISGNHKPQLRTVDEAIRRRLHLIPFTVTITPEQQDHGLPDKLRAEWGGVLRWIIDGAVAWHSGGLRPPAAVVDATREYLTAEDTIAVWLDERMQLDPAAETLSSDAFGSFRDWAEKAGERPGTQKAFSEALVGHGFVKRRTKKGMVFEGVRTR